MRRGTAGTGRTSRTRVPSGRRGSRATARRLSQAERSTLSEQRLLEAAITLMAERGYEATTLAAIGEAAGYSRGLATHRFGSKADLFAEVIDWLARRWRERLAPVVRGRVGLDALLAFVDVHRSLAEEEPQIVRALFVLWFQSLISGSRMREAAIRDLLGHRDWVQGMIERGIAAGNVRPELDAHAEAVHFCGTLFGLTLQWLIDPDGTRLDRMQGRFMQRLTSELGVQPQTAMPSAGDTPRVSSRLRRLPPAG